MEKTKGSNLRLKEIEQIFLVAWGTFEGDLNKQRVTSSVEAVFSNLDSHTAITIISREHTMYRTILRDIWSSQQPTDMG